MVRIHQGASVTPRLLSKAPPATRHPADFLVAGPLWDHFLREHVLSGPQEQQAIGFDFRPALKESIKGAGVPRGWFVGEHRGKVKLRVRAGAGGAAASWTKTLTISP